MLEKENTVEKRKHKRSNAQKDTYIIIENGSTNLGLLKNISEDGLSFNYIGNEEHIKGWYNGLFVELVASSKM